MQGLIPYQDYADSKGPLFWLIYGLSYLLTPTSHVGVCLFSILSYFISYIYSFKSLRLFVSDKETCIGTLLMIIAFWNPLFISETRAEHFTFPLFSICLYALLKSIININNRFDGKNGLVLGGAIAAAFLIKWSIAAMFWGFGLAFLFIAYRNHSIVKYILGGIVGASILILPFLIYFEHVSSFRDFIDEYVFNVAQTVGRPLSETLWMYVKEWVKLFLSRRIVFVLFVVSAFLYFHYRTDSLNGKTEWLVCLAALGIISIGIHTDDFVMYLTPMAPFGLFLVLLLMKKDWFSRYRVRTVSFLLLVHSVWVVWFAQGNNLFCRNQAYRDEFFVTSYYMGQIEKPYILNLGNETGVGTPTADVQPACKYWSFQRFSTDKMKQNQIECLHSQKPDFVTLQVWTEFVSREEIEKAGYHWISHFGYTDVFTKHNLQALRHDWKISDWDILLQRDLREIMYGDSTQIISL